MSGLCRCRQNVMQLKFLIIQKCLPHRKLDITEQFLPTPVPDVLVSYACGCTLNHEPPPAVQIDRVLPIDAGLPSHQGDSCGLELIFVAHTFCICCSSKHNCCKQCGANPETFPKYLVTEVLHFLQLQEENYSLATHWYPSYCQDHHSGWGGFVSVLLPGVSSAVSKHKSRAFRARIPVSNESTKQTAAREQGLCLEVGTTESPLQEGPAGDPGGLAAAEGSNHGWGFGTA